MVSCRNEDRLDRGGEGRRERSEMGTSRLNTPTSIARKRGENARVREKSMQSESKCHRRTSALL